MRKSIRADPEYAEAYSEAREAWELEKKFHRTEDTDEFWNAFYQAAKAYCRRHQTATAFERVTILLRRHLRAVGTLPNKYPDAMRPGESVQPPINRNFAESEQFEKRKERHTMVVLELTDTEADYLTQCLTDADIEAQRELQGTQKALYTDFLQSCRQRGLDIKDKLAKAEGWKKM